MRLGALLVLIVVIISCYSLAGCGTSSSTSATDTSSTTTTSTTTTTATMQATVATPTFSPAAGTYHTGITISISCSTPGAQIYYALNAEPGPDPINDYHGSFALPNALSAPTTTVYALATKEGMADSAYGVATYEVVPVPGSLGGGMAYYPGYLAYVTKLACDGNGNLYVGGSFSTAEGSLANYIAKWTGTTWEGLEDGLGGGGWRQISALALDNSNILYVGGGIKVAGTAVSEAKWNGSLWSTIGASCYASDALVCDNAGHLYAGGGINNAGFILPSLYEFTGEAWVGLAMPVNGIGSITALVFDKAGSLYAGGTYSDQNHICKWNGTAWSTLETGVNGNVLALAADNSGNVYAGGDFTTAGGRTANHVAKWNGSSWSALGGGLNNSVYALAFDSSGNLYAGGTFTTAEGGAANYIAKWNGTSWSALGSGVNALVYALAGDTSGNVYAAGDFTIAGGNPSYHVAKWNSSASSW